jgi:hypothetical protein
MTETVLDAGNIIVTEEAINFKSGSGDNAAEVRISFSAVAGVVKKGVVWPLIWPSLVTILAELSISFIVLSALNPLTRKPLADFVIEVGNRLGINATMIIQRFYDDHHLFLISMIFLGLALLPVVVAVIIGKGRLGIKLVTVGKPAVTELVIKAGKDADPLLEAITKVMTARQSKSDD